MANARLNTKPARVNAQLEPFTPEWHEEINAIAARDRNLADLYTWSAKYPECFDTIYRAMTGSEKSREALKKAFDLVKVLIS